MTSQSPRFAFLSVSRIDEALATAVVWWVSHVRRMPRLALALIALLSLVGAWISVTSFSIRTDTGSMLSEDLPFQKNSARFREFFPDQGDELVVVIDTEDPLTSVAVSRTLVEALGNRPDAVSKAVDLEDLPFFRKNGLLFMSPDDLRAFSADIARAQPFLFTFSADPSLHGFEGLLGLMMREDATNNELARPLPVLFDRMALVAEDLAATPEDPPRAMVWTDLLGSAGNTPMTGNRRFVLVRPVLDHTGFSPAQAAMDAVRAVSTAAGYDERADVSIRLTGTAALDQEELSSVKSGMLWPSLLSLLSVTVLLVIGLRSGRLILSMLAALAAGLTITAGFAFVAVGTLNLISVTFAVLFIGLSVDFGLHYGLRYREARLRGFENAAALDEAARSTGTSLVLSALAAMIAFFSFLPTAYTGLAQLGLISGVGMLIALLLNLTVLPAILSMFPLTPRPSAEETAPGALVRWRGRAQLFPVHHPRGVAAFALVLGVLAGVTACFIRFDTDPLSLKDPNTESMATLMDVINDPRVNPYTIDVLAGSRVEAQRLTAALQALPEVDSVASLLTLIPDQQVEKLEEIEDLSFMLNPALAPETVVLSDDDRLQARLGVARQLTQIATAVEAEDFQRPARRLASALRAFPPDPPRLKTLDNLLFDGLTAQIEALRERLSVEAPVTAPDIPADLRDLYLAGDGETYRLQVFPKENVRGGGAALYAFTDAVAAVAPQASGSPLIVTEAGRTVIGAFIQAGLVASFLIVALIFAVLRSVRAIVLTVVPLILAGVLTLATAVLLGQPLNLANVIVLPLLVGLGVAGAIHVLGRAEEVRVDGGAVVGTSTPRAVTFSALTTIASFGSLGASHHLGTQSMGLLLTLALTYSLFTNLWILPALIALWPDKAARASGSGANVDSDADPDADIVPTRG